MSEKLEIKWPWTMMWMEYADEFIDQIKASLPPDHEMQKHEIYPGIKAQMWRSCHQVPSGVR